MLPLSWSSGRGMSSQPIQTGCITFGKSTACTNDVDAAVPARVCECFCSLFEDSDQTRLRLVACGTPRDTHIPARTGRSLGSGPSRAPPPGEAGTLVGSPPNQDGRWEGVREGRNHVAYASALAGMASRRMRLGLQSRTWSTMMMLELCRRAQ